MTFYKLCITDCRIFITKWFYIHHHDRALCSCLVGINGETVTKITKEIRQTTQKCSQLIKKVPED